MFEPIRRGNASPKAAPSCRAIGMYHHEAVMRLGPTARAEQRGRRRWTASRSGRPRSRPAPRSAKGPGIIVLFSLSFAFLLLAAQCGAARQDPDTGKVRLLLLGWVIYPDVILPHYQADPLLDVTGVPLARAMVQWGWVAEDAAQRAARIYLPRSYGQFADNFDVVFLEAMDVDLIAPAWNQWFRDLVVEEGGGLCMTGGWASFGGYSTQGYLPWGPTWVGEILPVECLVDQLSDHVVWVDPVDEEDPMARSLPWGSAPPLLGMNKVAVRGGSKVVANARGELTDGTWPLLTYWSVGKGRAVCFMSTWLSTWGVEFVRWTYLPDFASYLVYFAAGLGLPDSPEMYHELRDRLWLIAEMKNNFYKLVDMIEMMGVSAESILDHTSPSDELYGEAQDLFRAGEYDAAFETADKAIVSIQQLELMALKEKDRAFFWIYLIDWLSVTSVAVIAGTFVWTLMIRRRLYRPVKTTRLA